MVQVPSPREIVVKSSINKKFTFDQTFGPESEQHEVYKAVVAPLIEEVLSGYNCTVFAYGQTGTGKTHTMVGDAATNTNSAWDDVSFDFKMNATIGKLIKLIRFFIVYVV